jgi:hypothetical protein
MNEKKNKAFEYPEGVVRYKEKFSHIFIKKEWVLRGR